MSRTCVPSSARADRSLPLLASAPSLLKFYVGVALFCVTLCPFADRAIASTITSATTSPVGGTECSQSSLSYSSCSFEVPGSVEGISSGSASYLAVSTSVGIGADNGATASAFAEVSDQLIFGGDTGLGVASFTFLVNIDYISISNDFGTSSNTCILGTCFFAQPTNVPSPFGGTYFSNGPTLYTLNVPFQFGQPLTFDFSSQSNSYSGDGDPGDAGSSIILEQLIVTDANGQPVNFTVQGLTPEPTSLGLTVLGLAFGSLFTLRRRKSEGELKGNWGNWVGELGGTGTDETVPNSLSMHRPASQTNFGDSLDPSGAASFTRAATRPVTSLSQGPSPILPIAYALRLSARCSCLDDHGPDDASLSY